MTSQNVEFYESNQTLTIVLLDEPEVRETIQAIKSQRDEGDLSWLGALAEVFEYQLCNSDWSLEDSATLSIALMDETCPILSREVNRDDQGNVTSVGRAFCYNDYAVKDELEELLTNGKLVFSLMEIEPNQ